MSTNNKRAAAGMPLQPSQKRPRKNDGTACAETMIEIRGVPPHVTPLLVQALRSATQFYQHAKESVVPKTQDEQQQESLTPAVSSATNRRGGVMDSVMSRIEASSSAESKEREKQQTRKTKMDQDADALMEAIRHEAQDTRSSHVTTSAASVPVSCLIYMKELMQTHSRVAVRRASLHVCGLLLFKSSQCRVYMLEQQEHLLEWIESVVYAPQFTQWKNPNHAAAQIPLLQQETQFHLDMLSDNKFSLHYPKLQVARRYLRQHCPNLAMTNNETVTGNYNMAQLRRFRDLALQNGDKECERVQRLVQRAQSYLNVLVPRFGQEANASVQVLEDEEEESDVDWEEGDADGEQEEVNNGNESHAAAVERTLQAMEHTGGLLPSGALEINFDETEEGTPVATTNAVAKERLETCVNRLSSRHMPRLSSWVKGLIQADGLHQAREGSSLVLLPAEAAQKRGRVLQALLDAKANVASILASAARLQVKVPGGEQNEQVSTSRTQPLQNYATPSSGSRARIAQISSSRRPSQSISRQRSNRVQIKYRTS